MARPSILLVPGSFAPPYLYQPIFDSVSKEGYEIKGVHPPSVGLGSGEGRPGPPPTMYDDAAYIAAEAKELADQGKDVIIIGHSYGGVPVSQSTAGLSKDERNSEGKPGGIVRLAYITSLVPPIGKSAKDLLNSFPQENQVHQITDDDGWMVHPDPAGTARTILQHISLEDGEAIVKKFAKHSYTSFINELTFAGYRNIPVSYLFCEEDQCIPPVAQKAGIEMIERESGRRVDVTSIKADHCPNFSSEKRTVEWILDVAKGV